MRYVMKLEKRDRTGMIISLWLITAIAILELVSYYSPYLQAIKFLILGLKEGAYAMLFIFLTSTLIYRCEPEKEP